MDYELDLRHKKEVVPVAEKEEVSNKSGLSWETYLSDVPSRRNSFLTMLVFVGAGAVVVYFQEDYLFGILLGLFGLVFMVFSFKKQESHQIKIDGAGISLNDRKYFYNEIKSFWLNYDPPEIKELSIEFKKRYLPLMVIPLEDANPVDVRKAMISLVPEKEHEDTLIDQIIRKLGL